MSGGWCVSGTNLDVVNNGSGACFAWGQNNNDNNRGRA